MRVLSDALRQSEVYEQILDELSGGKTPIAVTGCVDSEKCHLVTEFGVTHPCRLVITYREEKARQLYEDFYFFDHNTVLYPSKDILFYSADVHSKHTARKRIEILRRLAEKQPVTIILTLDALMERLMPADDFLDACIQIDLNSVVEMDALKKRLLEMGYEQSGLVENPGDFSVRGGILDVFPLTEETPIRIELWGDEVDSIRRFDAESQRTIENIDAVTIYPASELIITKEKALMAIGKLRAEYKIQEEILKKAKKKEERERLHKMVTAAEDELLSFGSVAGQETFTSYFYEKTVSLLDYLPEKTMVFFDEPHRVLDCGETYEMEFAMSMEHRLDGGYILPGQADLLYSYRDMIGRLLTKKVLLLSSVIGTFDFFTPKNIFHLECRSIYSYNNNFEQLVKDLGKWRDQGYRLVLLSSSGTRAKRLASDLNGYDLPAFFSENLENSIHPGEILVTSGRLSNGFEYPELKFALLTEKDIFKERTQKKLHKKSKYSGSKIASLADIAIGDFVVHERYGLGIYRGIEEIDFDGVSKDYINIEYKDSSNLFVPAAQLNLIQKYSNASDYRPKLNSLGGNEWEKAKSKVRSQVQIAAKELVELYAKRQMKPGYAYSVDTVWQKEFEERFPYEETEDQICAIEETKRDMESSRIMDRLICGDVGFGKTEIAIRAAFKAVQDSKQVVYLVPTTILAQQHYNSFKERMEDYPVNIAMLSRFCTTKEVTRIHEGLRKGTIDIVIGTHKVLSKKISFKNLGLLIIDEEQRFGVRQKETIKRLKTDVDVLSLSATPIPRTLHMSLAGIRDMSVLEEAPVDRKAIQTFVMEYNEELIREAIEREIHRGGQIFYVYNKVHNIDEIAGRVQKLVPDATVEFAHGQMGERQLEKIMYAFIKKEIDVLVCTTIIETGLDISNANTMIIHDAQNFGLSQLYQLRGRVGRSNRSAYAFLMYQRNMILKEEAEKRLKAIREFTDLGSGIKIAMRDLEIRGAGNLLGADQSGHMETVGYDMYCKMLNDAVKELKGDQNELDLFNTSVDLSIDAFIPATYVKNEAQKLELYKRIAMIENQEECDDMVEELIDRYGDVPAPLNRLLEVSLLKNEAHEAFISSIDQRDQKIHFSMHHRTKMKVEEIDGFLKSFRGLMKIKTGMNPEFIYELRKVPKKELLNVTRDLISRIKELIEE